jgi:hypothetical protein
MPMDPTKLTQSIVRLFGWVVGEVKWKEIAPSPPGAAPNWVVGAAAAAAPVARPLVSKESKNVAGANVLAHILAFSNEGRYTAFRTPALFLMRDEGEWVWDGGGLDPARLGLAQLDQTMFASNLKFWVCDRSAHIARLDVSIGTLQRMAIELETGAAHGRRMDVVGQESSFTARLGQGPY